MPKKFAGPLLAASLVALFCLSALAGGKDLIQAGNKAAASGQFEKAVQLFTQALRSKDLSPANRVVALNNRGSAKDDLGQTDWAILDYREALKIDPKYADAYYNLSYAHERKGQVKKAYQAMEKASELAPGDKVFHDRLMYLRGKMLKSSGS